MIPRCLVMSLVAAALLASMPALALAHAELVSSQPAAAASLDEPPAELVVTFDGELDPDGSSLVAIGPGGAEVAAGGVDLEVAERNVLRAALRSDGQGEYVVSWVAASIDGHVEEGSFAFEVMADATPPSPDTALPRPAGPGPAAAVLLALALVTAARAVHREVEG